MKRTIPAFILILCINFGFFSEHANAQTSSPIDLILLLDTSSGMSSSYEHVNNYITGAFLNEFLRVGDTFHLIAFSANPRLDAARRISGIGDVETIIGRMLLQYPVESGNNINAALSYAEQYLVSLPARPKKIVLVSTGSSDTVNLVNASRQRLSSRNTTIDFIQVTPGQPLVNLPVSGRAAPPRTTAPAASAAPTTAPAASVSPAPGSGLNVIPPASGVTAPALPLTTDSQEYSPVIIETPFDQPGNITEPYEDLNEGESWVAQTSPGRHTEVRENRAEWMPSLPLIAAIIIGILLLLGLILLLSSRKLGSRPNRVMAEVASSSAKKNEQKFTDHSNDLAKYAATAGSTRRTTPYEDRISKNAPVVINPSGPLLLNLFVEDQNTAIGKRNVHSLKSGYSLSVGGGKSDDFLIFLVPIPSNVGEIRRSGGSLTFVPRKPKYFPDIGSNEVKDCINKTIRLVSDKNYEMRFRFEMYEDPLVSLNRMLMSVKVPG